MTARVAAAAVLALAVAPSSAQASEGIVRDVRPTTIERGDTLVVECEGLEGSEPATVTLKGHSNGALRLTALFLQGRVAGAGRVLVDIDAALEKRLGGPLHITNATAEVERFHNGVYQHFRMRMGDQIVLRFFPHGFRRTASLFQDRAQGFVTAGLVLALALIVHLLIAPLTGLLVVWERKVSGRMQSRLGPNRVGPRGWLQWLADALKLVTKEDLIPLEADAPLFRLAPYLMWMSVFASLVVLPLSQTALVADMNVGILYLLSVTSLTVVGILIGGWSSNSKWSLLGGMRSAAQIVSYELPASLALLQVALLAGTLSPQDIVRAQGGLPHQWFVFANPFAFVSFFIYFISALAEGNRAPFDLPEAESELVAGYSTEYSGFRFSIFSLAEWTNMYVMSAIVSVMFLGGWNVPFVTAERLAAGSLVLQALSAVIMISKLVILVFMIIWIRWTLPRFRVDQMMNLCWKYLVPLSLACFIGGAAWLWATDGHPVFDFACRLALFASGGVALFLFFLARVIHNFKATRLLYLGDRQFTLPFMERHIDKRPPTP